MTHQSSKTQYYIPTPEAAQLIPDYGELYRDDFKPSKPYYKAVGGNDDPLLSFPKYNSDEIDEAFVRGLREEEQVPTTFDLTLFEWIIDCLEEATHRLCENVVSVESVERLRDKYNSALPSDAVISKIVDFWKERRANRGINFLRHEDLGKIGADPYVCFRRRELKVPRKTRRSDQQVTDRLKKLHLDLSTMKLLLQAAIKRDCYKREALVLEGELFEKYRLVDNWRRHNKSEWPPHLATFKTAAQSLLEPKKKKARLEEDLGGGYKIAIPVAVLKGSRHGKPYYPHDVARLVQRDLDALLGTATHGKSKSSSPVDDFCSEVSSDWTGQNYMPSFPDGRPLSCRRGRGGRLIFDRSIQRSEGQLLNDSLDAFTVQFHVKMLGVKDFTALQTQTGNYNVHAVQAANAIVRPQSYNAWLVATAPIVQALSGNKPKSPKKKRPREPSSDNTPAVEIGKLAGNAQITVKVKSQPKEARKGTGARFTPHGLAPEDTK